MLEYYAHVASLKLDDSLRQKSRSRVATADAFIDSESTTAMIDRSLVFLSASVQGVSIHHLFLLSFR